MPTAPDNRAGAPDPAIRELAPAEVERVLYLFRNVPVSPEAQPALAAASPPGCAQGVGQTAARAGRQRRPGLAGIGRGGLRKRLAPEAEQAALRAIGLNYYLSQAHFVPARAPIAQGKWEQARNAMQTLLQLQPSTRAAAAYAKRMGLQPPPSSTEEG